MNLVLVVPWDQQFGGVAAVVGHLTRGLRKSKDEVVFLYQGTQTRLRATLLRNSYTPGLLWLLPIKLVVSVHGADFFEDGERLRRYPWPLRFLLFSSDAVVAPSQAFLKDCLAALPRNCEQGSVHPQRHRHRRACPGSHAIDIVTGRRYVLCIAAHNRKRRWTCSSAPLPASVKSSETYSWCSSAIGSCAGNTGTLPARSRCRTGHSRMARQARDFGLASRLRDHRTAVALGAVRPLGSRGSGVSQAGRGFGRWRHSRDRRRWAERRPCPA